MLNAIEMHVLAIPTNSHYNKSDDLPQHFFALPDVNFQHFNSGYLNDYNFIAIKLKLIACLSIHKAM